MAASDPHAQVCFVIPCFRESKRLRPFLTELCEACDPLGGITLIVVDDGSGEEEERQLRALVEEFRPRYPWVREVLALPENVGKGGTVYAGWEEAGEAEWLMFADADGSVPAREVVQLIHRARESGDGPHAWFASRVVMLGKKVERMLHRDIMGQVFHWLVNLLLGLRAHDTQCGCKLIPRSTFTRIRPLLSLQGFAFDLDLLMALRSHGCEIVEVPVDWREIPGGKIRLLRDSWRMLRDVLLIRDRLKQGAYQPPLLP